MIIEDFLPPDPWQHIVSDVKWATGCIHQINELDVNFDGVELQYWPFENASNLEKLFYAYFTISETQGFVEEKINSKVIDLEFLLLWGEFQKAMAVIENVAPEFIRTKPARKHSRDADKEYAQAWYTLWYEAYLKEGNKKSRKLFDKYFEDLMQEIRTGKRDIHESVNEGGLLTLINEYTKEPEDLAFFQLTNKFRAHKFYGSEFDRVHRTAIKNRGNLPVVGEKYYPLKSK